MIYRFIVYFKRDHVMLFSQQNKVISFPSVQLKPFHIAETQPINDYLQEEFHLRTNVLKCFYKDEHQTIYEVEVLEPSPILNTLSINWEDPNTQDTIEKVEIVERWILEKWKKNNPPLSPWFEYGWREWLDNWVQQSVPNPVCQVEQIRSWEKAALYKVRTTGTNYYVKAVPPIFSHEPYVHRSMPKYVPEILAIHNNQCRLYLMRELKGNLLRFSDNINHWFQTVQQLAELQKMYINGDLKIHTDIPTRSIASILEEDYLIEVIQDLKSEVSTQTFEQLKATTNKVLLLIQGLKTSFPLSIDHGDLFGGNVIVEDNKPYIYDWSNASITHPFLSMLYITEEIAELFSKQSATQAIETYLTEWHEFGSMDELHHECLLIKKLEPIYYLAVHMKYIFPAFIDNVDKEQILADYVRKWLENLS